MPFEGPQGQGPFEGHGDCVDSMEDEEGISDADALCAIWERQAAAPGDDTDRFEKLSRARLLQAARDHPDKIGGLAHLAEMNGSGAGQAVSARQKAAASSPLDVVGAGIDAGVGEVEVGQKQRNEIDYDALPEEYTEALEADDFIVYGKASIEQYDVEDQRLTMEALTAALDRFFESDDAPGIISRAHADVPVGRPIREHTLDEDAALIIDGERYEFSAGDTLRTEAKDADDDGLPELWLVSRLANDSELARETRLRALQGDLNGFSVTVYPREKEQKRAGEDVTELDLHAVTIGTDEQIKNKGSEFGVAEFKALQTLSGPARAVADTLQSHFNMEDDETKTVLGRLLQRSGEELEQDAQSDGTDEAEQKADGGAGDESLASPIYAAVEEGTITAEQATTIENTVEKMDPAVVKPIIDAISENDLDVDSAVEMLNAMGSGGDADSAEKGDYEDDEDDDDEMEKADVDEGDDVDAEQKASATEVAQAMADRFGIPVDEVMEHLENLEMESEQDDAGELKAAAAAEAASEAVEEKLDELDDRVDELVESKLDEVLPENVPDEDAIEQKLDEATEALGSEVEEALQKADTTVSPSPTQSEGSTGANTLADTLGVTGGDD